jgi:predicted secreted hydrolase
MGRIAFQMVSTLDISMNCSIGRGPFSRQCGNSRRRRITAAMAAGVIGTAFMAASYVSCADEERKHVSNYGRSLESAVSKEIAGYATPTGPWRVELPKDYGAHPDYQQDYWSINGNLATITEGHFGFQLVVYRLGLISPNAANTNASSNAVSAWRAKDVYAGHFALTAVESQRFSVDERISRAALGLSGSVGKPTRVWVEDWAIEESFIRGGTPTLHIEVWSGDISISLALRHSKPAFSPGGDNREGSQAPLPFRAFSLSRLTAEGFLSTDGVKQEVSGSMWMDRAWGRVPITTGQMTLDRFLIHLSDGRELLLTQLRRRGGGGVPVYRCVIIDPTGTAELIQGEDMKLAARGYWQSPVDGLRYPSGWRVEIPPAKITMDIAPYILGQEITLWPRYWSGAVEISGEHAGASIKGTAYVQLFGYASE